MPPLALPARVLPLRELSCEAATLQRAGRPSPS
jgi:hypothetical protein